MELIADMLMIVGTVAVAIYCVVLARRLSRFTDLEKGVGGAIAVLSAQVDDMTKTLTRAQKTAGASAVKLEELTQRAEDVSRRLELLIASMHDLPTVSESKVASKPSASEAASQEAEEIGETLFLSQRRRVEAAE
ncbi:hypothetical protein CEW89_13160 [Celeribacter ethanolicus]|uniref:Uncharacterized protein n=1 Tax=Celeribacter ethanolicus TaxID=1758178 RepID=A0A291GE46_9RHOB|nr:hypothetical protein [Celeribacter ethanolicus]ATG48428.1 hypothetical protein CEW89_13160 [Celeribacter ethanolicus]